MLVEPAVTLPRRPRYRDPQPRDRIYFLTPNDKRILNALYHFGPLPPPHLSKLAGHASVKVTQQRLTTLYHGSQEREGCLVRPAEYRSPEGYYDSCVYDLKSMEHITLSPFINRTDHAAHRLMGACISASIAIALKDAGIEFLGLHDVLSHKKNTEGNGLRIPIGKGKMEPDWLFATKADKLRFYVCEWDRATEQLITNYDRETIEGKLALYETFFTDKLYQDYWGITNCRLLFCVTSAARGNNIMALVPESIKDKVFFKVFPHFGKYWRVPPVYEDILDGWTGANGTFSLKN